MIVKTYGQTRNFPILHVFIPYWVATKIESERTKILEICLNLLFFISNPLNTYFWESKVMFLLLLLRLDLSLS